VVKFLKDEGADINTKNGRNI